ncbi:MAG: hypothetical protein RLZZ342_255 [Candidatus Parcubacteria bacterium]|jgi:hypothetical protein
MSHAHSLLNDWFRHDARHFRLRVLVRFGFGRLRSALHHRRLLLQYYLGTDSRVRGEMPFAVMKDGTYSSSLRRDAASSRGWQTADGRIIRSHAISVITTMNAWGGYSNYRPA